MRDCPSPHRADHIAKAHLQVTLLLHRSPCQLRGHNFRTISFNCQAESLSSITMPTRSFGPLPPPRTPTPLILNGSPPSYTQYPRHHHGKHRSPCIALHLTTHGHTNINTSHTITTLCPTTLHPYSVVSPLLHTTAMLRMCSRPLHCSYIMHT